MEVPAYIPGTFVASHHDEGNFSDRFKQSSIEEVWLNRIHFQLEIKLKYPYTSIASALQAYDITVYHRSYSIFNDYISISKVIRFLVEKNTFSGSDVSKLKDFAASVLQNDKSKLTQLQEKIDKIKQKEKKYFEEGKESKGYKNMRKLLSASYLEKELRQQIEQSIEYNEQQKDPDKNLLIHPAYLDNKLIVDYPPANIPS